ncbi:MAG: phosphoenolpyruvate kinase, partial [Gemmatimonadota bacterium]|nr:phosphoenolpyruvate kinase [Gemmatimonadota bacterium]
MSGAGSLPERDIERLAASLRPALEEHEGRYPGDRTDRQPAHTVYGGAHIFRRDVARRLGDVALRYLEEYAPEPSDLAEILGPTSDARLLDTVHQRVRTKLEREPVEDFRIDFEDGFGERSDPEEDEAAVAAARETAAGLENGSLPPFLGIRIKPLSRERTVRALGTLDAYLTELIRSTGGELPPRFVVTLPKVVRAEQVSALVDALRSIEASLGLDEGTLGLELMVETTQSIIAADGSCPLPRFVDAAGGRCVGAHFGVYDYTAGASITARYQVMRHLACDFARQAMLVSLAGTGVAVSDGATNTLPVPRHRAEEGAELTSGRRRENREAVHAAWKLHHDDVRHSLENGIYQGWDLHPAQLVTRYAALYAFFHESLDAAVERLGRFVKRAARATLTGDVFDDAATGQGLLNYFVRGLSCGAITEAEAMRTGLSPEELRGRSFLGILERRREGASANEGASAVGHH